ncbi:MAG: HD domain-containing protein, partial [Candidatus Omnitrophica bacterium]|nr:HD domain-containing protein [Candidatus Omnitrophota bacterium]
VRCHHERYDGTGYPDQLAGDDIHVLAQIMSVADAYDAMTSQRPYRQALSREEAIQELRDNRNAQFNPGIADVFISILKEKAD